ncbi:hypothetical protein Tcan_11315 [Toxocara canis]|uniref:Uncharacterized protein n=1 Tax=Toxocara canis TaxID=6265 RepID=A0A0B2VY37_TOXCA|nr:hypothetical protein Tcan_11315 [Toxocara canis]
MSSPCYELSMLCEAPSSDQSLTDLTDCDTTGESLYQTSSSTNVDRNTFSESFTSRCATSRMSDDSCELSGNTSMRSPCNLQNTLVEQMSAKGVSINDTGLSFGITEKMARMALSDNHHRCYAEANSETNVVDPDLELAASELSFNLTDEERIYRRICEEAAKSSSTCTGFGTGSATITSTETGPNNGTKTIARTGRNSETSTKRSNSSVLSSEFAPAVMSTPYYERNDDSIDAVEFTFQPWGEEGDKWDKDSSKSAAVKKSMSPNDSSTLNDQRKALLSSEESDDSWLSSSVFQHEVRLARANCITNSTAYLEADSLSIINNHGNDSAKCYSPSKTDDPFNETRDQRSESHVLWKGKSVSSNNYMEVSGLSAAGSVYRSAECRSRNTSYHSISTSNRSARVNAISAIDPFIRYMSEKKRVIDAINEVSESEESDKDFESAILTQDSMRVQTGSTMRSSGWLRRYVERDNQSTSVVSVGNKTHKERSRREPSLNEGNEAITLTEISDIAQGGNAFAYQPRLLRSLSQSNISQGSVSISSNGTKFRSANSESSLLVDVQSIGDYGTHSRDSSNISANKRRPTRRRSKSCSASQSSPHFHCGDLPSLNDKRNCKLNDSTFAKTLKTDNAVREQQWRVKPNKSQWRNGEYFSDRWERFVSRKLLFDISKRFDECEDDEFDVFIPDEILERSSAKELAQTRLAVKRAVRHIRDDPRMAQILLDYTGDINDVSAARRHYRMTINNDTAFADLSKSFTSALIHFLSFSNEPPTEKDDEYHSATVEQKTEKLKCGRTRKKPLVSPK